MGYVRHPGREIGFNSNRNLGFNHSPINHLGAKEAQVSGNVRPKGLQCYRGSQTQINNDIQHSNQTSHSNTISNVNSQNIGLGFNLSQNSQ